jgi:hypothetical protein
VPRRHLHAQAAELPPLPRAAQGLLQACRLLPRHRAAAGARRRLHAARGRDRRLRHQQEWVVAAAARARARGQRGCARAQVPSRAARGSNSHLTTTRASAFPSAPPCAQTRCRSFTAQRRS